MISVIVSVYKVEPYLRRCLDSILVQTYKDFELILVDDGSPDRCPSICDEYAGKDSRVVVIHQANGGLSAARNTGIDRAFENSASEWLTFIDSDDWVHPRYLEILLNANLSKGTLVSSADYAMVSNYCVPDAITDYTVETPEPEDIFFDLTGMPKSYAWCRLIAKELFRSVRYPVGRNWEDLATVYKYLFREEKVSYIDEKLYYYFSNPNGIVNSAWTPKRLDELTAYESILPFFKEYKNGLLYEKIVCAYRRACGSQIRAIRYTRSDDVTDPKKYIRSVKETIRRLLSLEYRNCSRNRLLFFPEHWEYYCYGYLGYIPVLNLLLRFYYKTAPGRMIKDWRRRRRNH